MPLGLKPGMAQSALAAVATRPVTAAANSMTPRFDRMPRLLIDHPLDADVANIHLVVEADHGRTAEVPAQAMLGGAAANDLVREERMLRIDGIDLRRGHLAPGEAEQAHPPLHLAQHGARLLAHAVRRGIARPY